LVLPATLQALQTHRDLHVSLVGNGAALHAILEDCGPDEALLTRLTVEHAAGVVDVSAAPREVLRGGQDSSLHLAIKLLAENRVDGVVSAGSTSSLLALGKRHISILPGFSRPALCAALPVPSGIRYMLDLGANVDCDAGNLVEFAHLGSTLVSVLEDCALPRVALLGNGAEPTAGNLAIREAAKRMEQDPRLNFCGYLEGHELHQPGPEVVVCDGMLGDVALKTAAGTAALAAGLIRENLARHWLYRLLPEAAATALRDLSDALGFDRSGGVFLLGLKGVVVKSQGDSSAEAFGSALARAVRCVENDMIGKLRRHMGARHQMQSVSEEETTHGSG
jgi:glycerol-3-phosphate acyltransferase PlsX